MVNKGEFKTSCTNCGEIVIRVDKNTTGGTPHTCEHKIIVDGDASFLFTEPKEPVKIKDNQFLQNKIRRKKR